MHVQQVPEQRPDDHQGLQRQGELPAESAANKFGYLFVSDGKVRNHRGANSTTQPEATHAQFSDRRRGSSPIRPTS